MRTKRRKMKRAGKAWSELKAIAGYRVYWHCYMEPLCSEEACEQTDGIY